MHVCECVCVVHVCNCQLFQLVFVAFVSQFQVELPTYKKCESGGGGSDRHTHAQTTHLFSIVYHCAASVAKGAVNVAVTVAANTFCCFYLSFAFAAHRRCHNCLCLACFSFYLCSSRVLIVFLYTMIYVHYVCVCTRSCIDSRSETSMTSHSQTHTQSKTELVSRSLTVQHTHTTTNLY